MIYACCTMILLNFYYQAIFKEYGVPNFNLTKTLRMIYPLFKCKNRNYLEMRVNKRETSMVKVR